MKWYKTPLYVIVAPLLAGGWLIKIFVDALFDMIEWLEARKGPE